MDVRRSLRPRRRGVGLIELLVALAISASLLTAVAVAIDASFHAYGVNQELSDLTQRSRLAVHRMSAMIRQTKEHAPHDAAKAAQFAAGQTVSDTGIDMFDLDGHPITYRHDAANKRLVAVKDTVEHTLCEGVEVFTVTLVPMRSATSIKTGGSWDLLKRATILLTVRASKDTRVKGESGGNQTITLSTSVMPRRNAW